LRTRFGEPVIKPCKGGRSCVLEKNRTKVSLYGFGRAVCTPVQTGSGCTGQSQWCIKKTPRWGVVEGLGKEFWNILGYESERGATLFLIPAKPDEEVREEY
jgi:hypothetical protein